MEQQIDTLANLATPDSGERMDAWAKARKRADSYLKLHRIADREREHLLSSVARKLVRTSPCSEQELIQLFITTVQDELAAQKAETRTQTGPRFERSSIRVAPLRSISLLPRRSRQRTRSH
jgi:hypothetical protein